MEYEYAIEPEVVASSWNNCRYVMSLFGLENGRLISQFPSGWFSEIHHLSKQLPDMERSRVQEKLISAKRECKVMKFSRPYDSNKSWIENAIFEHQQESFGGVIVLEKMKPPRPQIFPIQELDEKEIPIASQIPTDEASILGVSHGLLRFGSRIEIVDPHFRLDRKIEDAKSRRLVNSILEVLKEYKRCSMVKIHYKDHSSMPTIQLFRERLGNFPSLVPEGMKLEMYRWTEKADCPYDFHGRYLLTDKGGVFFDGGFGRTERDKQYMLARLSNLDSHKRMETFSLDGSGHILVEPGLRIQSGGKSERV